MAIQIAVGSFTAPTATGTQAITSVGFRPTVLVFFGTSPIAGPSAASLGFDDATTHYGSAFDTGDFLGSIVSTTSYTDFSHSLIAYRNAAYGNLGMTGYVSSLTGTGFVITWDFLGNPAYGGSDWSYLAIGGSGVTAHIGRFNPRATVGTQSITGVGDQPELVFFNRVPLASTGETTSGPVMLGVACADLTQGVLATNNATKSYPSSATHTLLSTQCLNALGSYQASLTSMDADGFTLSYASTGNATPYVQYLAIGGDCAFTLGALTQPASTGTQTTSGLSVTPSSVVFLSACATTSTSVDAGCAWMVGACSASADASGWMGATSGASAPQPGHSLTSANRCIQLAHPTGYSASAVDAAARFSAFGSASFTLQWLVADATARRVLYLVAGVSNVTQSIIVKKVASPPDGTSFSFTAGGGLSPTTFDLLTGEQRVFSVNAGSGYTVSEDALTGWTPTYNVSNGSSIANLTVAAGETVTVLVTNSADVGTGNYLLRRQRRFSLGFAMNQYIFTSYLEILAQVAEQPTTGQGSNPIVMLRFSKDGCMTWGAEIQVEAGKLGEFLRRIYVNRLGRARDPWCELTVTDPVGWFLIDALTDQKVGTS